MKYLLAFFFIIPVLLTAQQNDYKVIQEFSIKSAGGWDYLSTYKNNLYVSHGNQVNILNKITGDSVSVIPNTNGVHGIAFDPTSNIGFTSNGKLNNVFAFNTNTNQVVATIVTGENPDAILYEPFSKTIITCNGRGKNITFIDAVSFKVIATTDVGGKPETAVSDEAGNIFVNIEDNNEIVKVNVLTHQVIAHWKIKPIESPTGLAIDIDTKRLFTGGEKLIAIVNFENGKVLATLPIGDGCDGVVFDKKNKLIFTSNGVGTMSIIKEKDANHFEFIKNMVTAPRARTIAIDESTGVIYMPTANFEPSASIGKRTPMIPGSFKILLIKK